MSDHLTSRAQRLIDEFEEGDNVRQGLANVLTHLAVAWWDNYSDGEEYWHGITTATLEEFVTELTAPTLLERAMNGDATAAKQFLHEAGFTDKQGQWLPQYQPIPETTND
jgi:hypothetical protein